MQSELTFLAALLVGFLGSTHCIGMCGGIAGTTGVSLGRSGGLSFLNRVSYLLLYNFGRITSYTAAGYIAATIGAAGFGLFPQNVARPLTAAISIGFLLALGAYLAGWWSFLPRLESVGGKLWRKIEPLGRRLLPVRTRSQAFMFGFVWGWLPCGLVYSVLAWAVATAQPGRGALLMLGFGLGTLPTLLGLGMAGQTLQRLRRHPGIRRAAGISLILLAVAMFALHQQNSHSHATHQHQAQIDSIASDI